MTLALTEAEFMAQVLDLAGLFGWESAHFRPALTSRGWRTPVQGSLGKGFPDLILVRPRDGRLIFAELKRDKAKPNPDQLRVIGILEDAGTWSVGGPTWETYVWHPADFDAIMDILR